MNRIKLLKTKCSRNISDFGINFNKDTLDQNRPIIKKVQKMYPLYREYLKIN